MKTIDVVLISGKQGSGKTTLAEAIRRMMFNDRAVVEHITFAEPLYRIHDFAMGILKDAGIERNIVKDGPLLQLIGTEWGRNTIDPNIWAKVLKGKVERRGGQILKNAERVIFLVSDCRFRNEFDIFPDALRVRLDCPNEIRRIRCSMWRENDQHPSETDLDGYAADGRFDMYFDTYLHGTEHCATLVCAQLDKRVWLEKRVPTFEESWKKQKEATA